MSCGSTSRADRRARPRLTLLVGILAMPVALGVRRLGVTLPVRRLVESADRTYQRRSS